MKSSNTMSSIVTFAVDVKNHPLPQYAGLTSINVIFLRKKLDPTHSPKMPLNLSIMVFEIVIVPSLTPNKDAKASFFLNHMSLKCELLYYAAMSLFTNDILKYY